MSSQKLGLDGQFTLTKIHFTSTEVQDKVDMLSLRAQGKPKQAKSGASDVASQMKGRFVLSAGILQFSGLTYKLPGADVICWDRLPTARNSSSTAEF